MGEEIKIIGLKVENILNIESIDMKIDGKSLIISGENGVGKSNRIDVIFMALTGFKPEKPIMKDKDHGYIEVDLGKYVVVKKYIMDKVYLEVKSKEGFKYTSPQQLLNDIIGDLSFDPGIFYEMKPKDQRDLLAKLVGLDFADLVEKHKKVYDKRTLVNQRVKDLKSRLSAIPLPEEATPVEEISLSEKLEIVSRLREDRAKWQEAKKRREEFYKKIEEMNQQSEKMRKQQQEILDQLEKMKLDPNVSAALPEEVKDEVITQAENNLRTVETINKKVREKIQYQNFEKEIDGQTVESDDMTAELVDIEKEKSHRIQKAQFPIPEMGIADEYVTYKNLPFSQLSDGEKLKIAISVGMVLNPKLKAIFIKKASFLDTKNLNAVLEMADKQGYQVFVERVTDDKEVKVVIH